MSALALIPTESFVITDETAPQIAAQLTGQYQKAKAAMAEIVIFGAMALQIRDALKVCNVAQNNRGRNSEGGGFKGWLEENCPDIDRRAAYRWMEIADGLTNRFKLESPAQIREVLTLAAPEGKTAKLQQQLFAFMEDKSISGLLSELKGDRTVPRSAGTYHPRQEDTRTPEERMAEMRETATTEAGEKLTMLDAWIDARNAEGSLTKPTRKQLADGLRALAAKVEK